MKPEPVRVTVVLSTYDSPERLALVLCGYARQTYRDFELRIADDGSGPATRDAIARARDELGLPIRHVWHEHRGFRKCAILNRAVEDCEADYLVFSDGDCVPRRDFVETHLALSEPERFLSGGCFRLNAAATRALTEADIRAGRVTDFDFLDDKLPATHWRKHRLRLSPRLAKLFDAITPTKATWNGHNSSCWRSHLVQVNGFDERMGYGGEDREFGERLIHAGIRPKQVRHRAICVHLWHDRDYVHAEGLVANRRIRDSTAERKARFTTHGIVKTDPPTP